MQHSGFYMNDCTKHTNHRYCTRIVRNYFIYLIVSLTSNMREASNAVRVMKNFITRFIDLDDSVFELLISKTEEITVPRKKLLIENGQVSRQMFFLYEGFVRFFTGKTVWKLPAIFTLLLDLLHRSQVLLNRNHRL